MCIYAKKSVHISLRKACLGVSQTFGLTDAGILYYGGFLMREHNARTRTICSHTIGERPTKYDGRQTAPLGQPTTLQDRTSDNNLS